MTIFITIVFVAAAGIILFAQHTEKSNREARAARLEALRARYGYEIATCIMEKNIWQGATEEMIIESLGQPEDIDEKVLKTKTKHTFKYLQLGRNRFALRVIFENGVCVGWDDNR